MFTESIDLNRGIDEPCEPETSVKPDCSGQHEKRIRSDEHVPKVEHSRDELSDLELCEEIEGCVEKEIERRRT